MMTKKELLEKISNDLDEIKELLRIISNQPDNTPLAITTTNDVYSKVGETLKSFGIPCNLLGYDYSREAILYFINNPNPKLSITKELYPYIATKFNTTPLRVERAIRHAIEVACTRGNYEYIVEFFGNTISTEKAKPTNSEFLSLIADSLSEK